MKGKRDEIKTRVRGGMRGGMGSGRNANDAAFCNHDICVGQ